VAETMLLYAGRLVPEKNVALLAELMRYLHRSEHRYRLVVAGDGPEAPKLAGAPGTTLLGFVRDKERLARLYASCDLFIFPSAVETFALGVLEALASGCRVVAVDGGAVAEVLPREAGVLVEASADAMAAGIEQALALTPGAGRSVATGYTWERTADALLALHHEARR
jgi:glycosyltransferase involved in cell wall biosynthesis